MGAMPTYKRAFLWLLACSMVFVGVLHFVRAEVFVGIVPPWLPWPLALVYVSGVAEVLGGLGLLLPRTRHLAAWGLIALYIAVFPANLHMAINDVPLDGEHLPTAVLWLRLPMQLVFIAWAWWFTKPDAAPARR